MGNEPAAQAVRFAQCGCLLTLRACEAGRGDLRSDVRLGQETFAERGGDLRSDVRLGQETFAERGGDLRSDVRLGQETFAERAGDLRSDVRLGQETFAERAGDLRSDVRLGQETFAERGLSMKKARRLIRLAHDLNEQDFALNVGREATGGDCRERSGHCRIRLAVQHRQGYRNSRPHRLQFPLHPADSCS